MVRPRDHPSTKIPMQPLCHAWHLEIGGREILFESSLAPMLALKGPPAGLEPRTGGPCKMEFAAAPSLAVKLKSVNVIFKL